MAKTSSNDPFGRFTKATDDLKLRIIANSVGEVGSGKTHFWLGAPGPIVIQTMDLGLEGVIEPFTKEKDIYVATYDIGASIGQSFTVEKAKDAQEKFIADFEAAIAHARTIIWDRETDMFELFQKAEWGTDDPYGAAPPKDWGRLKDKIRRMIALAKATDVNFGLIQGMRNEWGSQINKKTGAKAMAQTGKRIPAGMEDIEAQTHINLFHSREGADFSILVGKSRGPGGSEIQDKTLVNLTFAEFAQMVFPESDESDWT